MDPATVSAIIQGGAAVIGIIGQAIAAASRGEDPAPLLAEARRQLDAIGRESQAGDDDAGAWDRDLASRKAGGRRRIAVPVDLGMLPSSVRVAVLEQPIGERETEPPADPDGDE